MEKHTIDPFYNKDSEILILGSFPSVKSRAEGFYYAHPQNRFWPVLAKVFQDNIAKTLEEKKAFLLKHKIALFDVCATCEINASSDTSIKNVKPN
ncbi:MAG: DNA-deoxyinosine glycosylase, partial [Bacilli bacterium]|nr:DNA-deoxyinosine glycosylase [Bacilli bacterium]